MIESCKVCRLRQQWRPRRVARMYTRRLAPRQCSASNGSRRRRTTRDGSKGDVDILPGLIALKVEALEFKLGYSQYYASTSDQNLLRVTAIHCCTRSSSMTETAYYSITRLVTLREGTGLIADGLGAQGDWAKRNRSPQPQLPKSGNCGPHAPTATCP